VQQITSLFDRLVGSCEYDRRDREAERSSCGTSPVSNKKVSETALCYWNNDKSIAVGSIEDDGGRLAIVAESVTDSLKTSKFSFVVVPVSGYSGF
jgi:hypothetical protein